MDLAESGPDSPGPIRQLDGTPGRPGIAHGEGRAAPGRKARANRVFPGNGRAKTRSNKEKAGRKRSQSLEAKEQGEGMGRADRASAERKEGRGDRGAKDRRAAAKGEGRKRRRRFPLPASLSRERLLLTNSPPPSCRPLPRLPFREARGSARRAFGIGPPPASAGHSEAWDPGKPPVEPGPAGRRFPGFAGKISGKRRRGSRVCRRILRKRSGWVGDWDRGAIARGPRVPPPLDLRGREYRY
jgi:hypothetical protein